MDRLWAPWRMAYIENDSKNETLESITKSGCIFCDKPAAKTASDELIVFKGELAFVLMNIYPYNNGHLMVAPYEHTSNYEQLAEPATSEMTRLIQKSIQALTKAFSPTGFNVGMNLGSAAGAGIAAHLHVHIVPRWVGDANFMPVIGEVKVLPDSLEHSYQRIVDAWGVS